jgi:hypothetical protein
MAAPPSIKSLNLDLVSALAMELTRFGTYRRAPLCNVEAYLGGMLAMNIAAPRFALASISSQGDVQSARNNANRTSKPARSFPQK